MLTRDDIVRLRPVILGLARKHGACELRLIGSVARGESHSTSDADFLARFEPGRTLLDHGELIEDFSEALGVELDVIDMDALDPRRTAVVLPEAVTIRGTIDCSSKTSSRPSMR